MTGLPRAVLVVALAAIVLGVAVPVGTLALAGPGVVAPHILSARATLTVGTPVGVHSAGAFYAVNFAGSEAGRKAQLAVGAYFNSTPISTIRLAGGGDAYDPTTQTDYVAPPAGGAYSPVSGERINFTWFKAWCYSRTPHCSWIGTLPAEENNTTAALHYAKWFHSVLSFPPTYWQFGNEPTAWTHYGKNETRWSTTDALAPSGQDYATMVANYIRAITRAFPQDKFIGIENNCACAPSFLAPLVSQDSSKIVAVAYHEYPWAENSSTNVTQFLGALTNARSVPNTTAHLRSLISTACSSCANLPIQIGEYQAGGPVPTHSPFAQQYPGASFLAASVIQALEANVSQFTEFDTGWLVNASNGQVLPEGLLYQRILANMTMGTDYPVTVTAGTLGGLYGLLIKNGSRDSLLVVNTNLTQTLTLTIPANLFTVGPAWSVYTWAHWMPAPKMQQASTLASSYLVPADGLLLLDNY